MSSTNAGGSSAVGGEANTANEGSNNGDTIELEEFVMLKDDPNRLSWLDKKALARQLGCTVLPNTTWASLQPSLFRRLDALRKAQSPKANRPRKQQAQIDRIHRRKRKREEEAALDRKLLERLLREENGNEESDNGSSSSDNSLSTPSHRRLALSADDNALLSGGSGSTLSNDTSISRNNTPLLKSNQKIGNEVEFIGELESKLPQNIANHIKQGGGATGRKTKIGRAHFEKMQAELQQTREELIPLQIAEALFDFDLSKLIKYAIILVPAIQRRYIAKRKTAKQSDKSKQRDVIASIMEVTMEEDTEAEDIANQNTVEGIVVYATVVEKYVIPLVRMAWDPLLTTSLSKKIQSFIADLEKDNITDMHGWRKILEGTWTQLSLKLSSMTANFTLVRKMLSEVDLKQRFAERKQNHILQLVNQQLRGNGNRDKSRRDNSGHKGHNDNGRNSRNRNNSSSSPRVNRKGSEEAFAKLKSLFGENIKFDVEFYRKWGTSKHGGGVCLMGCLGGCKRGSECRFSHDYKAAFPKGDACITGKCDCPQ